MVDPRILPKALLLAAGLALPACQTPPGAVEPASLDEQLELPASWSRTGEAGSWAAGGWWRNLASPELDALVEAGLAGSPDLASAAQAVRIASLRLDAAGGAGLPQVDASLNLARARNNFVGLPIPGGGDVLTTYSSSRALSLNVAWELDVWGRLSSQEAGALAQLEASSFEWQAARLSLTAQVARLALGLGVAQAQVDLSRGALENAEAQLASAERLFELGLGAPEGILAARAGANAAKADLAEARRNLRSLEPALDALVGRAPGSTGVVDTAALATLVQGSLPTAPPAGLPAELLARRPDLAALEARLDAAEAGARVARADRYPRLSLTASTGTSGSELENLVDGDFRVWSLGANLLAPIFHGGALEAAEDIAIAQRDQALFTFASGTLRALAEVEAALIDEAGRQRRVAELEAQLDQLLETEALIERRQTRGSSSASALFDARARTIGARSQLLQARGQLFTGRIDLYLALGGGFDSAPIQ